MGFNTGVLICVTLAIVMHLFITSPDFARKDSRIANLEIALKNSDATLVDFKNGAISASCPPPNMGDCWTAIHSPDGRDECKRMAEYQRYTEICQQACVMNGFVPRSDCVRPCQDGYKVSDVICVPN